MDNELWLSYICCSFILIFKMMNFTWYTGRLRVARQVIHTEADRIFMKKPGVILDPTGGGHPDIDRIRAAHRSDVEMVVPFLLIMLLWLEMSPPPFMAKFVLRSFSVARILHGLFYMEIVPPGHQFIKYFTSVYSHIMVAYVAISCVVYCI